jgi:hypothetical protein
MSAYEFTVSLRIRHPSMDPQEITRTLNLEPQHVWKAGGRRCSPTGESLEGTYRESYWMALLTDGPQASSETASVESVLMKALVQLRRTQDFFSQVKADGGAAEFSVSIFGRESFALELSSELISGLGRLGLAIAMDVQPHLELVEPAES